MKEIKFRSWTGSRMMFKELDDNNWYDSIKTTAKPLTLRSTSDCNKYKIMQYTGLKDKNGVEIYEGDIVRFPRMDSDEYYVGIIQIDNAWSGVNIRWLTGYCSPYPFKLEVIGNIYENKDLLE